MSRTCPHCGFETDLAPFAFKQHAAPCPICGKVPSRVVTEETLDKSLRWIEQESPALFDRLVERMDLRAAKRRTIHRVALVTGVVMFVALFVLLLLW